MTGWRVWLAFEVRPGVTAAAARSDRSQLWRALIESCHRSGRLDVVELERWIDLLVEYTHLWGEA